MNLEDALEDFNNGEFDKWLQVFGSYDIWFRLLKKRGLLDEIDPHNTSDHEVWQNEYLLWLYESDKESYYKWVVRFLEDVIFENGKPYLEISERGDLSKLFCDGHRYDFSRDTIESILTGDGDVFERYWDTTDNVYRDVIEELTPENNKTLSEHIVTELKGKKIFPETTELELIASEQGHPEYFEINSENVMRIIKDEDSMKELLGDQLSELRGTLYSIHSSAYNSAYEEEVYNDVWDELSNYFEGTGEWVSQPHPYKKNTEIQYFRVPIRNFESDVNNYLYNNKGYGNSGTLEYHGSYIGIMSEDRDCLSLRVSDYPDSRKVDKYINEFFKDYI
jgi:hypothetical protein